MRSFGRFCTLAVLGMSLSIATVRADEEKIPLDKVPAPVLKAFKAKFPDATIKAAIKETEKDKVTYEIESTLKGLSVDAVLTPAGEFVAIEREMQVDDLPAAVTKAVAAKYPKSKIEKAEEVTKGDLVTIEVVVKTAEGKSVEVEVTKDGKVL